MRLMKRWLMASSAVGLSVIAAGPAAYAQATVDRPVALDTVLIKSGEKGKTADNTAIVSGDAVRNVSGGDLDSALRDIPGVFTNDQTYRPGTAVNIRGFEGHGRVNMMVDGVRQSFRNAGHEASGYVFVDPALLSEIDVTRGSSTGAGGGSLAGSVNMRTLGIDDVVREGQTTGGMIRLGYGNNGGGNSGMVAAGVRGDALSFVGALSLRKTSDYKNGDGITQPKTGQDLKSGLFKAEWRLDEVQTLNFGAILYRNSYVSAASDTYGRPVDVDNKTYMLGYRYAPGDGLIDFSLNAYLNDTKTSTAYAAPAPSPRVTGTKGYGFDMANTSTFDMGSVQVHSVNGLEYFRDKAVTRNDPVNPNNGKSASSAIYSDNTFTIGAVDVTAGLRFDHYKITGRAGGRDVSNSKSHFSPKLTVALNTIEGVTPYITWSRSMRAPSMLETMIGGDHGPGSGMGFMPNPDLKPETQQGFEIGTSFARNGLFAADDRLSGRISYFKMDVENYITGAFVPRGAMHVNHPGKTDVSGVELEASYDAGNWFGGLTYAKSDSNLPPQLNGFGATQYPPDNTVTLTAGMRLLDETLTIGARYNHVSGGDDIGYGPGFVPLTVRNEGSYKTVDIFSTYKASEMFDVNLRVSNLFDEAYTPFLGSGESRAYGHSGRGRTVELSGQMRF